MFTQITLDKLLTLANKLCVLILSLLNYRDVRDQQHTVPVSAVIAVVTKGHWAKWRKINRRKDEGGE